MDVFLGCDRSMCWMSSLNVTVECVHWMHILDMTLQCVHRMHFLGAILECGMPSLIAPLECVGCLTPAHECTECKNYATPNLRFLICEFLNFAILALKRFGTQVERMLQPYVKLWVVFVLFFLKKRFLYFEIQSLKFQLWIKAFDGVCETAWCTNPNSVFGIRVSASSSHHPNHHNTA